MKIRGFWIYALVFADSSLCFDNRLSDAAARARLRRQQPSCYASTSHSVNDIYHLDELLQRAELDLKDCQIEPLSGIGFCNVLYKVQCLRKKQIMVGKLFSSIAKRRMTVHGTRVDWMASKRGLGPKLFASTNNGILMEWLDGDGLNETIVHTTSDWIEHVAHRLAAFHSMQVPPDHPHMLWETMEIMMDMIKDTSLVREEVKRQRELLEPLHLPVVLGHGDFKPSNVITDRFIDFEISGMHYKGFDIAKLFRTDHPTELSDDNMHAFLECYLQASSGADDDCTRNIEQLRLETRLMEPLTVRAGTVGGKMKS